MDFWNIVTYGKIGKTLESAEKYKFGVSMLKVKTGTDSTEEIRISDLSDEFKETIKTALEAEYKRVQNRLTQLIKNEE